MKKGFITLGIIFGFCLLYAVLEVMFKESGIGISMIVKVILFGTVISFVAKLWAKDSDEKTDEEEKDAVLEDTITVKKEEFTADLPKEPKEISVGVCDIKEDDKFKAEPIAESKTFTNMENNKRDFNWVAIIFLVLLIIRELYTTFEYFISSSFLPTNYVAMNIIISVLIALLTVFVFMKNKYAMSAILALFVIRIFSVFTYEESYIAEKIAWFFRDIMLVGIPLFFKKNGISGWQAIYADDEFINENYEEKEK